MTKKHFIALANFIRDHGTLFTTDQIYALSIFCANQNPRFKRQVFLDYIAGKCGPNGGALKK